MTVTAVLALEDGTIFNGQSIGAKGNTTGEVVFNTALTGYQEILSDPSYSRQIVTLTYPHIGNTGTTPEDLEAPAAYAAGLVVRDVPPLASNWRKSEDLREFLARHKIVAISGIDTRKLTRILREKGAQAGCIMAGDKIDPAAAVRLLTTIRCWVILLLKVMVFPHFVALTYSTGSPTSSTPKLFGASFLDTYVSFENTACPSCANVPVSGRSSRSLR